PGGMGAGGGGGQGGEGGAPPVPCTLLAAGEPLELVSFSGDAGSAGLAVLDAGSTKTTARVLHQAIDENANFWHPELDLADYAVGSAWPGGVMAGHAPTVAGIDAHASGIIAPLTGAPGSVGLLWYHGDLASANVIPGVKFRTFDATS